MCSLSYLPDFLSTSKLDAAVVIIEEVVVVVIVLILVIVAVNDVHITYNCLT
jgi:hypothetical protein